MGSIPETPQGVVSKAIPPYYKFIQMETQVAATSAKLSPEDIADISKLAFKAVEDYVKSKGITRGLTKGAHAGAMVHALIDSGILPEEVKAEAFHILCRLENGSQLRQELEKSGALGKEAIATEYMP